MAVVYRGLGNYSFILSQSCRGLNKILPIPNHLQEGYNFLDYKKGDFPISKRYAQEILSPPMFPELT